ncbi:MAG: TetR/AcrR family transcriptional regulator [Treponema sp.]|nr:TetR/AcrR family transcriptional regulator [Treponema sp.]MDE6245869.1 TetR/AcrR family transcriptional regulator [Treponemataceae bacterium]MBD5409729.1 TetR/AcrR family transcriptional regulator [Treponema sp.]MBD5412492.1 TetR/AcrR family transcriptional regulator [Treponema sp.]MBD5443864.1 TetR/AcrR family transcriptional regulator [Treponema sp.]
MPAPIEHIKRKHEILEKALSIFVEEGYENVTFQKIANHCEITRTTLYIYFKNKHDIFLWSLKQLTSQIENDLMEILNDKTLSAEKAIRCVLETIIDRCQANRKLFIVLLPYLSQIKREGVDTVAGIRRRTIKFRHIMVHIIIKGIKNGEFKNQNVRNTNEILYGIIESAIFKIAIMNEKDIIKTKDVANLAIDNILS